MTRAHALILVMLSLFVTSCGFKPAQSYVATGTLILSEGLQARFDQLKRTGVNFELVMTARTSPSVGDVVIQRRWHKVAMPFEFGLGKGRAEDFAHLKDGVFLTAHIESANESFKFAACGFSAKAIPVGTYHVKLQLALDPARDEIYRQRGAPVGGWESPSIAEEAVPPSKDDEDAFDPGPRAFSGRIETPKDLERAFTNWRLFLIARERADRGFPELVLGMESPSFPLDWSLHQNHRQGGGTEPIQDPKFVALVLDRDGNVTSKDDQFVIATDKKMEIGSKDILFKLPGAPLRKLLMGQSTSQPTSRPATRPTSRAATANTAPKPKKGVVVATGTVLLPERLKSEAEGAVLWISVRDGKQNTSVIMKRFEKPTFPFSYVMRNGEGEMAGGVSEGHPIVVRAILTKTGPLDKSALSGLSQVAPAGKAEMNVELAEPR